MFSTMKKIAIASIILCVFNIIGVLFLYLFLQTTNMGFILEFSAMLFLVSTSAILLMFSCGMLGMCNDLQYQHDYLSGKLAETKKRVEELERRG